MVIKELFGLLGIKVDDAAFKKADGALYTITQGLMVVKAAAENAAASLKELVSETLNQSTEIAALATLMGVGTDQAQEWAYAAQQTGLSADDLGQLVAELAENIGEAAGGTGEAAQAFKGLGVSLKDTNGKLKETPVALAEIADKLAGMADGQAKTAAILGLFGDEGLKLLPILNQGSEGLKRYAEEARAFGLVLEQGTIEQSADLAMSFKTLTSIADSVRYTIGAQLVPVLWDVSEAFLGWYKENQALIKQGIGKVFSALISSARTLYRALTPIGIALKWVGEKLSGLADGTLIFTVNALTGAFVMLGVSAVASGTAAALAWIAASWPLIALASLVGLLALLAEDVWVWFKGGQSVLGDLLGSWNDFWYKFIEAKSDDPWWLVALKTALRAARDLVDTLRKLNPQAVVEDIKGGIGAFTGALGGINDNLASKAKENRRNSGKLTTEEKMQSLMQGSTWLSEKTGLPDFIAGKQMEKLANFGANFNAYRANAASLPMSAATQNSITNTQKGPTTINSNVTINVPDGIKNKEEVGIYVAEKFQDLFGVALGSLKTGTE